MRQLFFALCFFALSAVHSEEIMVSAAASLKDSFTELGKSFEQKNKVKVVFNFAASGQLKAQIEAGAPVDVFASAALADMDALDNKNFLEPKTKNNFAKNSLVLAQSIKAKITLNSLEDLKKPEVKKIAMGNPETVPAGRYAKEALVFEKHFDLLKEKLVWAENARQVLDYISRDEVDAGFVFLTDVLADKNVRKVLELSEKSHNSIVYPAAVIKSSKNIAQAKEFVRFLSSKEAVLILNKYGFK